MDAVIIGAGVIGCSIALELSRQGMDVAVVDKGPAAGAGSTSSSSAIIRFNYSTADAVTVAWEAKHLWEAWPDVVGAGDGRGLARFHRTGLIVIEPAATERPGRMLGLFDEVGVPYEHLDIDEVRRRLPAVDTASYWPPRAVHDERFWDRGHGQVTAYSTPDAGFVDDPQLAAHNLMVAARQQGARFRFRQEATAVHRRAGRVDGVALDDGSTLKAGIVVNAAGPYSARVNGLAGISDDFAVISTRPLRQEVHVLPGPVGFRHEDGAPVVMASSLGTYFRPHLGGTILAGGMEPDCDPLVWVDDPDSLDPIPTVGVWEAQTYRVARRIPGMRVPTRPVGLAALYDVTPDWTPVYDRTSLDGFYVAIGTSGNQFKNAPIVGRLIAALVEACEAGHDHDADPVCVRGDVTGRAIDLRTYSRLRERTGAASNVMG